MEDINALVRKRSELVYNIIDRFEDLLERHNIMIPSEDDDGTDEFRSNIYGTEYYELEDDLINMIAKYDEEKKSLCNIIKN